MTSKDWIFQQYIKELANGKLPLSSGSFSPDSRDKKDHRDIYKKPSK